MATANWMVAWTIRTLMMLGSTCRSVMPSGPCPIAVAARTKSRLHIASAAPRVTRANTGMLKMAIARMAFCALALSTEVIRMAISTAGKAKIRSEVRDSASSTQPPRAAAQAPSVTPADMPPRTASAWRASAGRRRHAASRRSRRARCRQTVAAERRRPGSRYGVWRGPRSGSCPYPRPRIEKGVGEIDQEVDGEHQDREQQDHVLDHDQVTVVDRIVD